MRRLASGLAGDVVAILDLRHRFDQPGDDEWISTLALRDFDLQVDFAPGAILPNGPTATVAPGGPRGEVVDQDPESLEQVMLRSLRERTRLPVAVDAGFLDRDLDIYVQLPDGVLHVLAPRKRLFSSTTYIFVMWMAGTAMILFGIATVFMSNQVRSIRRLAVSADGFGKGRDLPPIKLEGAREVRQAAQAFNLMRERIQRQVAQRTEMLAGVSHDLRTPLTRMKLQLAMMPEGPDREDLSEDVAEMERMVEGYLAFARGEGGEAVTAVDLVALVDEVVGRFRRENSAVLHVAGINGAETLILPLRRNAMERCLSNLIGNACRYGKRVEITLQPGPQGADLVVDDDGPGIPPAQREEVFRPFVRGEPSRNPTTGGTGLGLTIARDVARVHGGDITLSQSPSLGGLRARLHVPR
jgi:two-component system osmolarity sensor histidine kinase EnvZ